MKSPVRALVCFLPLVAKTRQHPPPDENSLGGMGS
jgi:hypothetical protein